MAFSKLVPCLMLLLVGSYAYAHTPRFIQHEGRIVREINACILNDTKYPVSEELIDKMTTKVFGEYLEIVDVKYKVIYRDKITFQAAYDDTLGTAMNLLFSYPEGTDCENWIIFTNAFVWQRAPWSRGGQLMGLSHVLMGIALVFNTQKISEIPNPGGQGTKSEVVLKHELGHLFLGPDTAHSKDPNSFMSSGIQARGFWTTYEVKGIKSNFGKYWRLMRLEE